MIGRDCLNINNRHSSYLSTASDTVWLQADSTKRMETNMYKLIMK